MDDLPPPPSTETMPGLEAHLGYWLRRVSNHVSGDFARRLQARHTSVAEWVALRHLHDHPNLTPGELADRLGMTRGAISKVIDKLENKQWIARTPNPDDNRVQWLTLTPAGAQALPELARIADSNDQTYFDCLDAAEQATLRALLQKLTHVHQWNDTPTE